MVIETSRPIARVAKELGINEGTLGNWVSTYRRDHAGEEPLHLRAERVVAHHIGPGGARPHQAGVGRLPAGVLVLRYRGAAGRASAIMYLTRCGGYPGSTGR